MGLTSVTPTLMGQDWLIDLNLSSVLSRESWSTEVLLALACLQASGTVPSLSGHTHLYALWICVLGFNEILDFTGFYLNGIRKYRSQYCLSESSWG